MQNDTGVASLHSLLIPKMIVLLALVWSAGFVAASHCPADVLIMYQTVLHTEWSEDKFPKQYPEWRPPAQWSVVVGRSHNASGVLWRLGKTASDSMKLFVETGKVEMLIREEQKTGILSEFFAPPVSQGVGTTRATFFADSAHSKVSLMCRITPSPDWFIGVDSYELCADGEWADTVTLELEPRDGGTDSGYTFTSPKWATVPRASIAPIASRHPHHPAGSFFYPKLDRLPPIAHLQFIKLKEFRLHNFLGDNKSILEKNISRAGLISPLSELRRLSAKKERKMKRDKNDHLFNSEINDFRSKAETTIKHEKSSLKKRYRKKSCQVSEWSEWGMCSKTCGFGEQFRKRKVIHFGSRNSRPCPPLEESRWCRSSQACHNKTSNLFRWH